MDRTAMSLLVASILEKTGGFAPEGNREWQETITRARALREQGEWLEAVRLYRDGMKRAEGSLGEQSGEYWFLLVYLLTDLSEYLERQDLVKENDPHFENAKATIEALQKMLTAESADESA